MQNEKRRSCLRNWGQILRFRICWDRICFHPINAVSSFSLVVCQLLLLPTRVLAHSYNVDVSCILGANTGATVFSFIMANSRFQYVKKFELPDAFLPDTYLIARLDGHRFTRFTADHSFTKPNDERGLLLMAEVSYRHHPTSRRLCDIVL